MKNLTVSINIKIILFFFPVDVWEPGEDDGDEPIIHHGGTLTSKLSLISALDIISELAFERTRFAFLNMLSRIVILHDALYTVLVDFRYPLFIRLEVHLVILVF